MLRPVEKLRVSDEIVDQLRTLILTGHYRPGDKLPAERVLSKTLGVNRASLREALKRLEHQGLVCIRQGDGTRVEDFMRTGGVDLVAHMLPVAEDQPDLIGDVLEFRRIFARQLARLAAERATAVDHRELHALSRRPNIASLSAQELLQLDFEFYLLLAVAAQNRVMMLTINSVRNALHGYLPRLAALVPPAAIVQTHQQAVCAAVCRGDADEAEALVDRYMKSSIDAVVAQRGGESLMARLRDVGDA